jgi:VanZ family protein
MAIWLIVTVVLGALSLRGSRGAYVAYMLFAILFIPARAGFQMQSLVCETPVSVSSALYSLQNWQHIILSALVSLMTLAQFREERGAAALLTAIVVTVALGVMAELEQGLFRSGHCRMRDLVPDTAGAVLGAAIGLAWRRLRGRRASPAGTGSL